MRRFVSVLVGLALMFSLTVGTASAYYFASHYPWVDRVAYGYDHYIPVCLGNLMDGPTWDIANNDKHYAAFVAFSRWDSVASEVGGELLFYATNTSCSYMENNNYEYVSINRTFEWPWDPGDSGKTITEPSLCWFQGSLRQCIDQAHVWLNFDDFTWNWNQEGTLMQLNGKIGARTVLTHEIGHAVGCGHWPYSGHVMATKYSWMPKPALLSQDDKNCYNYLY